MISPQLTIISAAMSLGGMASVGFNHHREVEKLVSEFDKDQEVAAQEVELAVVSERVEVALTGMEEALQDQIQLNQENYLEQMAGMQTRMELMQTKLGSQDVLMSRMAEDYSALEFRWETLADGFRPIPSIGGRFQPVKSEFESEGEANPLLPPVSENATWTDNY